MLCKWKIVVIVGLLHSRRQSPAVRSHRITGNGIDLGGATSIRLSSLVKWWPPANARPAESSGHH